MKMIMLVALLASLGCSKKAPDCGAAIAKAMERLTTTIKSQATDPKDQKLMLDVVVKLNGVLTKRCQDDKWPAEAVSCFTTAATQPEMQGCENKLNDEQRTKVRNEVREVMMSSLPMPAGHSPTLDSPHGGPRVPPPVPTEGSAAAGEPAAGPGTPAAGSGTPAAGSGTAAAGSPPAIPAPVVPAPPTGSAGSADGW